MNEKTVECEWADVILESAQEGLPEGFDVLACIVASVGPDNTAVVGVAVAPGLDKVFAARMLHQLAARYAQDAGVTL